MNSGSMALMDSKIKTHWVRVTNKKLKSGNGHITYHTTQLPATKAMQAFHPKASEEKKIINGLKAGSKQVS